MGQLCNWGGMCIGREDTRTVSYHILLIIYELNIVDSRVAREVKYKL